MAKSLAGSCLCGGVTYAVTGPLTVMARCHCAQCRKASGAEFATNATVASEHFEITSGKELLAEYAHTTGQPRVFCGRCGSPIIKRFENEPEKVRIRLGCLDSDIEERAVAHAWVCEKPNWSDIHDDLPQFDTVPKPPGEK
jgi:hypothetical protein